MSCGLIGKFEVIDRIDTYFCVTCHVKKEGGACGGCMIKDVKAIIDDTNSVDAAPVRHGVWLPTSDENKKRCSRCDVIHLIAQYPHGRANYCPNCGAKMDGDEHAAD